jgi:integrase
MATIRKRQWRVGGEVRSAWIVRYADQAGKRHIKTFETKREAEAWAVQTLHEVSRGMHTAASASITVRQAFEKWITHCEKEGLEYSTLRQRRQHLVHHIEPFIGAVKLSALTLPRVHQFNDQLRDAGRSLAMRRKIVTNLGTAIRHAMSEGRCAQNVVAGFTMRRSDRDSGGPMRPGVNFPTKSELKAILDSTPDKHRAFICVLIFTGMRISEIRGLRWSDVDLDAGVLHIRQRATIWGRIGPPKSKAGLRDIPLVPLALNALKAHRLQRPRSELDLVFCNRNGGVSKHAHIERWFKPLQLKCGIARPYGFHSFRHAFASLAIETLRWQPKQLQAVMGHATVQMTFDRYGHLFANPEADKEGLRRLEAAIGVVA